MVVRRQYGGWVADRDPTDWDNRVGRQNGSQMNKAIDPHLATLADSRLIEHGGTSRQKHVIFKGTARARGPIRTLFPMVRDASRTPRRTAVSITMQLSPMKIGPLSATSTQPKPIEQFEPIVTSPQITAFGAIRDDTEIFGFSFL